MFKFMERWKNDPKTGWPAVGKGLPWVDDVSWEALQARVRVIHGGTASDGYTGQRKQDGTPDKRTKQGQAWVEGEPEPELDASPVGVYAAVLQNAGAVHGIIQKLHEEVRLLHEEAPPTKAPNPVRKAAWVPIVTEED